MLVELLSPEFEIYKEGKPTGYYARGIVLKEKGDQVLVECLSNGKKYEIKKNEVKVIQTES